MYLGISREWIPPLASTRYLPEDKSRIIPSLYLKLSKTIAIFMKHCVIKGMNAMMYPQDHKMVFYVYSWDFMETCDPGKLASFSSSYLVVWPHHNRQKAGNDTS